MSLLPLDYFMVVGGLVQAACQTVLALLLVPSQNLIADLGAVNQTGGTTTTPLFFCTGVGTASLYAPSRTIQANFPRQDMWRRRQRLEKTDTSTQPVPMCETGGRWNGGLGFIGLHGQQCATPSNA